MKKALIALLVIVCFCLTAEAKLYVTLHKITGKPQGTVSIADEIVADWAENFILVEADESYRGKQGYKIKYETEILRHATQEEIDAYLDSIKPKTKKEQFLEMLNDEDIVNKIKDKTK